eukprot:3140995-Pleurochrysis_carterae.AAC.18
MHLCLIAARLLRQLCECRGHFRSSVHHRVAAAVVSKGARLEHQPAPHGQGQLEVYCLPASKQQQAADGTFVDMLTQEAYHQSVHMHLGPQGPSRKGVSRRRIKLLTGSPTLRQSSARPRQTQPPQSHRASRRQSC